jgi:SAM-dependent methyltransferase
MPEAVQHYREEAGRQYHAVKRGLPPEAVPWVARLRAEKFQHRVKPTDTVFEFGAGAGWNLMKLSCARKLGHDVSDFLQPELAKAGIEFIGQPEHLPAAVADVILCHHALEHVLHPPKALTTMKRLVKPGGVLLLHVPFEKERRYRRFDPGEPNHHLYSWNVQTLGALVTECGWKVEQAGIGRFGYDRFAAAQAMRLKLGETGFRIIHRLLHCLRPGYEVRIVARPA